MRLALTIAVLAAVAFSGPAYAQDIDPASGATRYVLDTAILVFGGFGALVALAGLCMREAGLARPHHTPSVCLRVLAGFGVAALAFWLTGYNLIYTIEEAGLLGDFQLWAPFDDDPMARGHASAATWFFQATLAAIVVAAVSGAVSERVKLWPFLLFAALLTGLIYPIAAAWTRGEGYFAEVWGFYDYGGAVLHIVGGAAALAGAMVVGPRAGRYADGSVRPAAKTALSLSALGACLFVPGWVLVLAAMYGSFSSVEAVISVSVIAANASVAAAGGILSALTITKLVYRRAGLVSAIAGAVGGLVGIAADPLHPVIWQAAMIGAVGGVIVTIAPPFLDRFKIDDAGFCVPAHLLCGLWGAAIAPWTNSDIWFVGQFIGLAAVAAFAFFMSLLFWVALKYFAGVRLSTPEDPAPALANS